MSSTARRRWPWVVGLLILLALLVWVVFSVIRAAQAAQDFRARALVATQQAQALQTDELAAGVPALGDAARQFQATVSGPLWAVAGRLPVVGSAVTSAQDLAAASVSVTDAAADLAPVLPLVQADRLRTPDGAIDVSAMRRVGAALAAAEPDLAAAAAQAQAADPGAVGPVGEAARTAQEQLVGLPQAVAGAATAFDVGADLLGAKEPQTWMVLLQNGSEARGTGGFLGAYALLEARSGKLTLDTVDTNNSLNTRIPNSDMPREFLDLWTREYTSEWNSYNLSRHFPYTGVLSRNGMAARDVDLDAVIGIDAYGVAALLAGTGPVTVGADTVTADNAVEFFNAGVYRAYPDQEQKDAVVVAIMEEVLQRFSAGSFDLAAAAQRVPTLISGQRLLAWTSDPALQARIEPFGVAGVVPDQRGPWVAAALNNSAGNKLDAFVASDVSYSSSAACSFGTSEVTVTLTNNTPPGSGYAYSDAYYPGSRDGATRMWTAVYGPVGAQFRSASIDGRRQYVDQGSERGHPVWRWNLDIPRGESTTLTVRFTEPASAAAPLVFPQAMAVPQTVTAVTQCPGSG